MTIDIAKNNYEKTRLLYPDFKERVQSALTDIYLAGYNGAIFSGYRSYKEQNALYNKHDGSTKARGGQSWHNFGLAVDWVFITDTGNWTWGGPYEEVASYFKTYGLQWGYDLWGWDMPHMMLDYGATLKELDALYKVGGLDSVWDYLKGIL